MGNYQPSKAVLDHLHQIADETGNNVTIDHAEPRRGGVFLRLSGDGNPWQDDDEQEDILCHKNEADQTLHLGKGQAGDWHYVYVSRDENSPNGGGAYERRSSIHLWLSPNEDPISWIEAQNIQSEYALEGIREFLLMGSWLLRHVPSGKFLTPEIEKSLNEYNRKAARS